MASSPAIDRHETLGNPLMAREDAIRYLPRSFNWTEKAMPTRL